MILLPEGNINTEEKMNIDERWKYLRKMKTRYRKADKKTKGQLLDEMQAVTGMHRKAVIRSMNSSLKRKPRRRERGKTYGPGVDDALRVIDESFDHICPERLTPNLVWMARHLARHNELRITPSLLDQLGSISISTVRRRLDRIRQDQRRLPRKKPRGRRLVQDIPMKRLSWDIQDPGHCETDLVHHCGHTASGEYLCTLQMIDVATGWSERYAVLGRSYLVMKDAFLAFLTRLPFPIKELHPDNGSEFFNHHMLRFWGDRVQDVTLSRSRPYQKNDNPRVEQKNATLVRAYLGYARLDTVDHVLAVNRLYDQMWIYYNLFQPVMHLVEKEIVREDGQIVRVRRRHDKARTPFDRLCQTKAILPEHREQLETLRDSINPRRLREEIHDDINAILELPCAQPGSKQDVHLTLTKNCQARKEALSTFAFNRTSIKS
jgi:hypothetical protein